MLANNRLFQLSLIIFLVISTVFATLHPAFIAAALVLLFVVWQSMSLERSLYIYLIAVTFNRMVLDIGGLSFKPEMYFGILCIITILIYFLLKKIKVAWNVPITLFLVYILYTTAVSVYLSPVLSISINGILQITFSFFGFVILSQFSYQKIYNFVDFYIGLAVFQSIYSLICFLYNQLTSDLLFGAKYGGLMIGQNGGVNWTTVTWRGGLFEANLFSAYMGVAIVFLVAVLLLRKENKRPLWTLLSIILCIVGIIMGWTRSAWIGSVLGILLIFLPNMKRFIRPRNVGIAIGIFCILIPLFFVIQNVFDITSGREGILLSKFTNLLNDDEGTGKYRVDKTMMALNNWLYNHPIVGNGYFSIKETNSDEWINSMFLAVLHDSGVLGLIPFVSIIAIVFINAIKVALRTNDEKQKIYLIGMISGTIVLIFSYNFSPGHTLAMFWVHLGFIWTLSKNCTEVVTKRMVGEISGQENSIHSS